MFDSLRGILLFSALPWTCLIITVLVIPRQFGWFFTPIGCIVSTVTLVVSSFLFFWEWCGTDRRDVLFYLLYPVLALPSVLIFMCRFFYYSATWYTRDWFSLCLEAITYMQSRFWKK
jgi:hypothetical protein